jgi:hypothetical protein
LKVVHIHKGENVVKTSYAYYLPRSGRTSRSKVKFVGVKRDLRESDLMS